MTVEERWTIEPKDVLSCVLVCKHCKTRIILAPDRWQINSRNCPGCGTQGFHPNTAGVEAARKFFEGLDTLREGDADAVFQMRLEITRPESSSAQRIERS